MRRLVLASAAFFAVTAVSANARALPSSDAGNRPLVLRHSISSCQVLYDSLRPAKTEMDSGRLRKALADNNLHEKDIVCAGKDDGTIVIITKNGVLVIVEDKDGTVDNTFYNMTGSVETFGAIVSAVLDGKTVYAVTDKNYFVRITTYEQWRELKDKIISPHLEVSGGNLLVVGTDSAGKRVELEIPIRSLDDLSR